MCVRRLVDFPYVLVLLRCDTCKRAGSYRLARLAVKYGAEILLEDLLVQCGYRQTVRGETSVGPVECALPTCRRCVRPMCPQRSCDFEW
jgi:hypothetical protein